MSGLYEKTVYAKEMYDRSVAETGRGVAVGPRRAPRPKARGLVVALRDADSKRQAVTGGPARCFSPVNSG